jgi:hypothetical protein
MCAIAGASLLISGVSCGTILYPERRGQPAGRLDAGVVALDAVGLLLFLVPGVIAFAVDFSNGTIYLPSGPMYGSLPPSNSELKAVRVSPPELTSQRIETIVRDRTGQTIRLEPGEYQAAKLDRIQDITPSTCQELQSSKQSTTVAFRNKSSE